MGQHVNLSARLMSAAEEGAVIISPSTRRAVERHIALRDLPPVKLKGVVDPVPIAAALRPFDMAQDNRRSVTRPDLVGREQELGRIVDQARVALNGSGRVVALVGEAGAGKTRTIEESLRRMGALLNQAEDGIPPFFLYSVECQSYEQNTPYALIRELLRMFFNLRLGGDQGELLALLSRHVEDLVPDLARFTPLLGDLLGFPLEDTPLTAALTPEQRHDRAQELVEALLLAEAREQPLALIFDDLHWADASSLEMLMRLIRRAPSAPLLILLGYRMDPPIPEPWRDLAHAARVAIGELAPEDSVALVRALLRDEPPPALTELIEKAQGNPFFIEEVVRGLVESGAIERSDDGWRLTRELDEATMPDSIEGVITARLDRLEDRSREVLQVAAVVGRRFSYPVLSNVVSRRDGLQDQLRLLSNTDLILPEAIERELAYLFRHALTRDVAYEAILYARRRDLHRRVAQQIEQLYPDRLDEQLALLARHYLLAEDWGPAFDYHLRAGRQAQGRYANREAITLYERALQIVPRLERAPAGSTENREPAGPSGSRFLVLGSSEVVELHERLGVVRALIGEYDAALERYQAALDLLVRQPQATLDEQVRLHHHIARVYEKRAEFEKAFEWVERAMALAGDAQSRELVRCLLLGAGLHLRQGRNNQTLEWGERALRLAEQLGSLRSQAEAFMQLGSAYGNLGDNTRAFELTSRSLQLYEQAQDLTRLADVRNNLAIMAQALGRMAEARAHFEASAEITQAMGDVYGQAMVANNLGDMLRLQDQLDEAIEQYRRSLTMFERLGSHYATGVLHMNLGATYLLRGDLDIAEGHLARSAELFEQVGAEDFLPELERYLAELHLRRGDLPRARLACEMSLANAARLEARAEEGATRRTLGSILSQGGDYAGAWEELQRSLAILREAASPHEIARTLVALAALAPALGRPAEGQAALDEALPILREIGAQRDIAEAREIAAQHGFIA
jgi:tetratricopeptide (TPR) repeat protein